VHLAVLAVLAVLGLWWFTRSRELFVLSVRQGRVLVVRGRVPPGLLRDFRDILGPTKLDGTVKALASEDRSSLVADGDVAQVAQRLRNTFGLRPVSQLRQAPLIERPNLGQLLGIAWLAWLLEDVVT
jgi:Protein of unknown function (DUF3634)